MSNFVLHHDPVLYYAFGLIRGIYHPSEKNFLYGHFLTDDGISISAQIPQKLAAQLRENPELLSMPLIWRCYPSFDPPSVKLYKICLTQPNSGYVKSERCKRGKSISHSWESHPD
jgi:hypothetical protein